MVEAQSGILVSAKHHILPPFVELQVPLKFMNSWLLLHQNFVLVESIKALLDLKVEHSDCLDINHMGHSRCFRIILIIDTHHLRIPIVPETNRPNSDYILIDSSSDYQ